MKLKMEGSVDLWFEAVHCWELVADEEGKRLE